MKVSRVTTGTSGLLHAIQLAEYLAFSVTFMEVDNGYVARAGATPTSAEEVDRAGVKIAVAQGSAPHTVLTRLIKNAEIIQVPGGFEFPP